MKKCDVLIIGGGPAGAIAGANLAQKGFCVELVEKLHFPRFVIGESLLPLCNAILAKNNLLNFIEEENYLVKGGAIFRRNNPQTNRDEEAIYDFSKNLDEAYNSSFQVKRESFDHKLLQGAESFGVKVSYGQEVIAYNQEKNQVSTQDEDGNQQHYQAKFVLDASGYGRVFPRLLALDIPSNLKPKNAIFTRIKESRKPTTRLDGFITVFIHEENQAWIWVIPFADGVTSVGIVCDEEYFEQHNCSAEVFFDQIIEVNPQAKERFKNLEKLQAVGRIKGYASNVKQMYGEGFALAGNATEFLDPVFSSGVTLALKSGDLSAELIAKQLQGEQVDWEVEYQEYMRQGIDVFRAFVNAWYDGRLHTILFSAVKKESYARAISSILSGYVWNEKNIFVGNTEEKIDLLVNLINQMER